MYSLVWFLDLPDFGSLAYFDLLNLFKVSGRMALLCKLAFSPGSVSLNMEFLQLSHKSQDLMSTFIADKNCSNVSPCCWFQLLNINLS